MTTGRGQLEQSAYLEILKKEITPATGCTEPIAIAYAVAKAKNFLSGKVQSVQVNVSRNMMKNAMGVGIPGTGMAGIGLAAALGAFGGDSSAVLEVLHNITPKDIESAKSFTAKNVTISLKDTPQKLYIEAIVKSEIDTATVVIKENHTNITTIVKNGKVLYDGELEFLAAKKDSRIEELTVEGIYDYVSEVPLTELQFLNDEVNINWQIAQEGLNGNYGLRVGKISSEDISHAGTFDDACNYAVSLASAAADARMSGCQMPVMTVCGSGNQGITATVPVIAVCDYFNFSMEQKLRALALSCLLTIHVKHYIGKLSPICGCGMGSSIGVCAAVAYLLDGTLEQVNNSISNVIADVSGIICDGAKSGCALKVATVVNSAFRGARLALHGLGAGSLDGIVSHEIETSIRNIGRLGNEGMADTDKVILDIMVCK